MPSMESLDTALWFIGAFVVFAILWMPILGTGCVRGARR